MSQFIEMFGAVESTKPLTDFIEVSFPGEWGQEDKSWIYLMLSLEILIQ